MNIDYPIIYEIARNTYAVNEFGMSSFFILVGETRGLVIDCGCGSFDTRDLVERLCPLPYDVVITHGHGEHCGGMGFFEKVWIHPADMDMARDTEQLMDRLYENKNIWDSPEKRGILYLLPGRRKWTYPAQDRGARDFYNFKHIEFRGLESIPEFLPLRDGQTFDLGGGRIVSVLHLPGHSKGHCVFIDSGERLLFSGDACCSSYNIREVSLNTALKGFLRLWERRTEYDRNFSGHTASGSDTAGFSLPYFILTDCIEACRIVLNGTADTKSGYLAHNSVRLYYNPERLLDPGELPAE